MTDELDGIFNSRQPQRPSFTERLGQGHAKPVAEPQEETAGSGQYKPYGFFPSGGVGESCDVFSWVDATQVPHGIVFQYRFLMQVGFTGDEMLRLMLPDCIVVINGKNLLDLRRCLSRRTATFIQQYHPGIWPMPAADEPIIERIEIARPESFRARNQ
jgi:hypothetical protein